MKYIVGIEDAPQEAVDKILEKFRTMKDGEIIVVGSRVTHVAIETESDVEFKVLEAFKK